ncbi:hypothetical protein LDO32_16585 [Luteimonas sp. Y-2-2-4F]|nr:hypothetical protein [Luteimonas sp. Y-2-2-4F]MCD9033334.1 hypothetical protein [Luteimonas sp. Y-2-2-4F]
MSSKELAGGCARIALAPLLLFAGLLAAGDCAAQRARSKADAWIGRDAGELLMQLRVDGGRVQIDELDETGETRYTWSSWNPAWTETVTTGGNVIGMHPGGPGVAPTPIFDGPAQSHEVHHDATHRCDISFFADAEGIVSRWEYTGSNCNRDIKRPRD